MALQLFRAKGGFSDGLTSTLSGAGVPGGDASFQDAAGIGSTYRDTVSGALFQKNVAGAGTANWVKQANVTDLAGLSAVQSWREPALVRDAVNTSTANSITEMNTADTLDGITIAAGDRVLLSEIAAGAGPNIYIVGGSAGAWTLTEDDNNESAGDTTQILSGTSSNQIWFFNGAAWAHIGSQSSSEDSFLRSFIGKGAAGAEMPAYANANYVAQADSLATAIGKLDAQVALNATAGTGNSSGLSALQVEVDATQSGAGLAAGGAYNADAAATYISTATSIHNATQLLDAHVALNASGLAQEILDRQAASAGLLTELDVIEAGTGLAADGTYITVAGSNYIDTSTTVVDAVSLLDAAIGSVQTSLTTETTNRTNADTALDNKIGTQAYSSVNYVAAGSSSTAAISALDAAIADTVAKSTSTGITSGIVDSVSVDTAEVVKWIVTVQDTGTNDKYSAEILAMHNGSAAADATLVDFSEAFELEIGAEISGLAIDVVLSGAGVAQTMQLSVSSASTVNVKVTRLYV